MKSYGQFCGVARALDVIGDRWSLLILRELLIRPCRYTDLRAALPGVATNLLSTRLRELEETGLITHDGAGYAVTERGAALRPVLRELVRWAIPYMVEGQGSDAARGQWLVGAVDALFHDAVVDASDADVVCAVEDETVTLALRDGHLEPRVGDAPDPALRLRGSLDDIVRTLVGMGAGATVEGDAGTLAALQRSVQPQLVR